MALKTQLQTRIPCNSNIRQRTFTFLKTFQPVKTWEETRQRVLFPLCAPAFQSVISSQLHFQPADDVLQSLQHVRFNKTKQTNKKICQSVYECKMKMKLAFTPRNCNIPTDDNINIKTSTLNADSQECLIIENVGLCLSFLFLRFPRWCCRW